MVTLAQTTSHRTLDHLMHDTMIGKALLGLGQTLKESLTRPPEMTVDLLLEPNQFGRYDRMVQYNRMGLVTMSCDEVELPYSSKAPHGYTEHQVQEMYPGANINFMTTRW